jgi:hypothetical protein
MLVKKSELVEKKSFIVTIDNIANHKNTNHSSVKPHTVIFNNTNHFFVYANLHFKCNDSWFYDQKTASKEDLQTLFNTCLMNTFWTDLESI